MEGRRAIAALALGPAAMAMAKLAASELITNALEHSGLRRDDVIELTTELGEGLLRISVRDPGPGPGHRLRPGLGLRIVERASDRWGFDRGAETTCWWFEIDLDALGASGDAQGGHRAPDGLAR